MEDGTATAGTVAAYIAGQALANALHDGNWSLFGFRGRPRRGRIFRRFLNPQTLAYQDSLFRELLLLVLFRYGHTIQSLVSADAYSMIFARSLEFVVDGPTGDLWRPLFSSRTGALCFFSDGLHQYAASASDGPMNIFTRRMLPAVPRKVTGKWWVGVAKLSLGLDRSTAVFEKSCQDRLKERHIQEDVVFADTTYPDIVYRAFGKGSIQREFAKITTPHLRQEGRTGGQLCPHCAAVLRGDARFCVGCGRAV